MRIGFSDPTKYNSVIVA